MNNNYRIKYKIGDHEIEIESSDKSFVETKVTEFIQDVERKKPSAKKKDSIGNGTGDSNDETGDEAAIDVAAIANAITESEDYSTIEKKIINKSSRLNRLLLIFYFANELHGSATLTSGDVERITDQLGIRITTANVASALKINMKYFTADAVRKRGAIVRYKINKKGIDEFKRIIEN